MGAAGQPLGRYLLGERLAVGGMGEVYVGVQRGLGDFEKPLAIKLLLPHLAEDPAAIAEFLNEAKLASRLSHPHVVQIFDVGQEGGRYYLAMELVRGISLAGLLARLATQRQMLAPHLVSFIAHGLLDGLQHAHDLKDAQGKVVGLVHRDVSPHNLLLSVSGEVKLCDFGIARAQDTKSSTRTGTVRGKPAYLAPEVFDGVPANRSTDLFAAAVTIFQVATLTSPFRRETDAATMKAIFTESMPPLRSLRPELPGELERALAWATERDPEKRAPTAQALHDAIPVNYGPTAGRELGALVARLGAETVGRVESGIAHTRQLVQSTREASVSIAAVVQAPTGEPPAALPAPASSRRTTLILGAVAVVSAVVTVAVAFAVRNGQQPSPFASAGERTDSAAAGPTVTPPAPAVPPAAEVVAAAAQPPTPAAAPGTAVAPGAEPDPSGEAKQRPANKAAGPADLAAPEPAPAKGPAAVSRPARPSGPRIGFLTVDATPWASVSVRGRAIGDTPLYRFPLDEGEVSVELKNPDTGKAVTRRVKVVPGKETSLKVNLQ